MLLMRVQTVRNAVRELGAHPTAVNSVTNKLMAMGLQALARVDASGQAMDQSVHYKIAVAQMTSTGDQVANFAVCSSLAEDAKVAGCEVLFLPECCSFIGESGEQTVRHASSLDGVVLGRYRDLAKRLGIWINVGGFQEVSPDPNRIYNTQLLLNGDGNIVSTYRKIHLFDVAVKDGPILMESRSTVPGDSVVTCNTPVGRMGLTTCYDVRFPALYEALRFEQGAEVLTVPSAFTVKTGEAHWEILLRARAVETQCYVVAAAQAGRHNSKRQSYGHAMIVDPYGRICAQLEDPQQTGIAVATVDHSLLRDIRINMPIEQHRAAALKLWRGKDHL